MKCEICGEREGIIEITHIVENEENSFHICLECAAEQGFHQNLAYINETLEALLNNLPKSEIDRKVLKSVCSYCTTSYEDFYENGKLGCSKCYSEFFRDVEEYLSENVELTRHKGRLPSQLEEYKNRNYTLELLQTKLIQALQKEEYEEAAKIRDKIATLET